jgi:hypothetical protein
VRFDIAGALRRIPFRVAVLLGTLLGLLLIGGPQALVRIPLIVIAGSGIVITDSADHDHAVGAKRR